MIPLPLINCILVFIKEKSNQKGKQLKGETDHHLHNLNTF